MPFDCVAATPVDWANKFGIPGDNGGLSAGRKRRRPENDGKQLNDVPDTSGRDRGRVRNMICFNGDVRTLGTIDGRHVASPTRAPNLNPTRNEGGTVAG
jgi:hypothetical protein